MKQKNRPSVQGETVISEDFKIIFDKIILDIDKKKKPEEPFVLGLGGMSTSGKTTMSINLSNYLNSKGFKTQSIHLDDFHFEKCIRNFNGNQAEVFCDIYFNISKIINFILEPLNTRKELNMKLSKMYNYENDLYDIERDYKIDKETIVIFEGIFVVLLKAVHHRQHTIR